MKKILFIVLMLFTASAWAEKVKWDEDSLADFDTDVFVGDYTNKAKKTKGKVVFKIKKISENVFEFNDLIWKYEMTCVKDKWRMVLGGIYTDAPCLHFDCKITNRKSTIMTEYEETPRVVQNPYVALCPPTEKWGVEQVYYYFSKEEYNEYMCLGEPWEHHGCTSTNAHIYKIDSTEKEK